MVKNCDNCKNQNPKIPMQTCNSFGYPLFADCENWEPKNEQVGKELENDKKVRKMCWR